MIRYTHYPVTTTGERSKRHGKSENATKNSIKFVKYDCFHYSLITVKVDVNRTISYKFI